MKHARLAAVTFVAIALGVLGAAQPDAQTTNARAPQEFRPVVDRYCATCHNQRTKAGGLALDQADLSRVAADPELWEKVIWKLRSASMPPIGLPRPDKATYEALASALEGTLDRAASAAPNPGRTPAMHRLNRAEYRNAIRDLLGVDIDVTTLLPSDSGSYGFDNIGGVLSLSSSLMDRYMSVAERVSSIAIGAAVPPTSDMFRVAGDLLQDDRMTGLPFGTRGGTAIKYTFPQDGEYKIRLRLGRNQTDDIAGLADPSDIEISIDGERVQMFTVGGDRPPRGAAAAQALAPVSNDPDGGSDPAAPRAPAAAPPRPASGGTPIRGDFGRAPGVALPREAADAKLHFRSKVKAGPRTVVVTFIKRTSAFAETTMQPYLRVESGQGGESRFQPYLTSVVISGPFNGVRPVDTPSRQRIFSCYPSGATLTAAGRSSTEEDRCARQILSTLARRAYRRPVSDADVKVLFEFFKEGRANGTFDAGIDRSLRRLLVDPEFLFRVQRDPAGIAANTTYRVGDVELASRLSFFLWSSGPDDELLNVAARGKLKDPTVLQQQVRRMLKDERADALVTNFAGQWLYLRNVPSLDPNDKLFPDFDESLRQAMKRETELFVQSVMREDRSVLELLSANYTFVNERLAKHYGISNVYGTDFRRVTLTDPNRGGLLGQASILAATSEPTRTSPVRRGKWVLENLLGAPPPPPPPDVPSLKENAVGSRTVLTMREQMEQHRKDPACASCHKLMDPIGLALENFDAVGRWRASDPWMLTVEDQKWRPNEADRPIDAQGTLPDGTPFAGPSGLKRALLAHPDQFVTTLTEKLMIYALGRGVEYYDRPAIRTIARTAAAENNRFTSIVLGIVSSAPFQTRMSENVN